MDELNEQRRPSFEDLLHQKQDLYRFLMQAKDHEEAIERAVHAGEHAIPWLVEWVARERGHLRFRAVETLKRLDKEKVIPYFLIKLNTILDKDDEFVYLVLEIARTYRDPRIPQFILEQHGMRLRTAISDQLHMAALITLAEVGDRSQATLMAKSLKTLKRKVPNFHEFWFPHTGCFVGLGLLVLFFVIAPFIIGSSLYGFGSAPWFYLTSAPVSCIAVPAVGLLVWRHLRWITALSELQETIQQVGHAFVRWEAVEGIGAMAVCAADRLTAESASQPLSTLLSMLQENDFVNLSEDDRLAIQRLLMTQTTELIQSHLIEALPALANKPLIEWLERQISFKQPPGHVFISVSEMMPLIRSAVYRRLGEARLNPDNEPQSSSLIPLEKKELLHAILKERNWGTARQIALAAGDKAIPWFAEWFFTGTSKVHSVAHAVLRQIDASKVVPALVAEFKRHPDKRNAVLTSLLDIADTHHDTQLPVAILIAYQDYYYESFAKFVIQRSIRLLMQNGNRSHGPLLAEAILRWMKQNGSQAQFWVKNIAVSGCLAICITPALIAAAPVIYFQYKKWKKDIENCNALAVQIGNQLLHWESVESIGTLAQWASNSHFETPAILTIDKLLDRLNRETEITMQAKQTEALNLLLFKGNNDFRRKLARTAPYWGDSSTLRTLIEVLASPDTDESLRQEVQDALLLLQQQIDRMRDVKTLMRPSSEQEDTSTLMRPASPHPDIPPEQLLRHAEEKSEREDRG